MLSYLVHGESHIRCTCWLSVLFCFLIIYFLAVLGLHCCSGFFLGAATGGFSLVVVTGFSLLWLLLVRSMGSRAQASAGVARGLSCGFQALERSLSISSGNAQAWLLPGMWDLPGQGSDLCLLHWQAESLPQNHQGSPIRFKHSSVYMLIPNS